MSEKAHSDYFYDFLNAEPSLRLLVEVSGKILAEQREAFQTVCDKKLKKVLWDAEFEDNGHNLFRESWDVLLEIFFGKVDVSIFVNPTTKETEMQAKINVKKNIAYTYIAFCEKTGERLAHSDKILRAVILLAPEYESRAVELVEDKAGILWDKYIQEIQREAEIYRHIDEELGDLLNH